MRLARRRAADAPPPQTPDADVPPPARPVAAFAGILDGVSLWVAVDAQPGHLALREQASGTLLDLPADTLDDQPAYLAARLDLGALVGPDAADTHEVVLVPPGRRDGGVPVWTPPLAESRSRQAPDGRTRLRTHRADDGTLQVRRRPLEDAVTLRAVDARREVLRLLLAPADRPGPEVALLADDDTVVATWPVADDAVELTIAPLAGLDTVRYRVVCGRPGAWLPVRRDRDDLPDPGQGAPLPQLHDPDTEEARLRLRWSPAGLLIGRVL